TGGTPDDTYATALTYHGPGSQAGQLQSKTDPVGNVTTYGYDAVGRRTSMVDPLGNAVGGVPADHTWLYEYDRADRSTLQRPAAQGGAVSAVADPDPGPDHDPRYDLADNTPVSAARGDRDRAQWTHDGEHDPAGGGARPPRAAAPGCAGGGGVGVHRRRGGA